MVTDKRARGDAAEALAQSWLESKGYTTIETNFSRRVGEVDLVMQAPGSGPIVFVEVRFRKSKHKGGALESVDFRKQRKLRRTAIAWLQKNADSQTHARIDVIAIEPAEPETDPDQLWRGHQMHWVINAVED